jgi:small subunit ribosomal protein S17
MENKTEQKNISKNKVIAGTVVSAKMKDSIVVKVEYFKKHLKYGKFFKVSNKIMAHDAGNTCKEGDKVEIIGCRPISKRKSFTLLNKTAK